MYYLQPTSRHLTNLLHSSSLSKALSPCVHTLIVSRLLLGVPNHMSDLPHRFAFMPVAQRLLLYRTSYTGWAIRSSDSLHTLMQLEKASHMKCLLWRILLGPDHCIQTIWHWK